MKKNLHAFSLLEFSIVILIAAVLVFGVMQANRVVKRINLNSAKALTQQSIVLSTPGLILWLETSLSDSLSDSEKYEGAVVTIWKDISPQNVIKNHAIGASAAEEDLGKFYFNEIAGATVENTSGPIFVKNGIGNIPTLRFTNNGANAFRYMVVDPRFKNSVHENMTMFLVAKYRSGSGALIDRACTNKDWLIVGCDKVGPSLFGAKIDEKKNLLFDVRDNDGKAVDFKSGLVFQPEQAVILTFERNYGEAFNIYVNGSLDKNREDGLEDIALHTPKIGRDAENKNDNSDVDISEIIFYSGLLDPKNRDAIEEYLGKKYGIKVSN